MLFPWFNCPCSMAGSHVTVPVLMVRLHRGLRHSTALRSWDSSQGVSSPSQTGFQTPSQQESSTASSQGDKEDLRICQSSVPGLHSLCCAQERTKYSPK